MTNFNPYTGNKKPYGSKKKAKPTVKTMPYKSKGKAGKLKMASGGMVEDLTDTQGYSPGTNPRVEEALNQAGVGVEQSGSARKVASTPSSKTETTPTMSYTKDKSKTGKGKTFAEIKAEQDAKFAAKKKKKKN